MAVSTVGDFDLKSAADYQQLVDDIESLMASPAGLDPQSVARLQARFDLAIKAINTRLRDCDQLLKKGLRNEALERSEIEPKVLDLVLIVDFPERDSWEDTVRQCGLTPVDLLVSVAGDLKDASASEKPLAELKYQVRLHALAHSPLPIRISLMRKLAKVDQNSTIWDEDLKVFEKARHNQLAGDCQTAIRSGNLTMLESLQEELQSPDWSVPPAKGFLKQVSEALTLLRRQNAREELQTLEPELTAAFAAFDVPRGREVRESWRKLAEVAALPESDSLIQSVMPAMQWLDEQDQQDRAWTAYAAAVATLTQALDMGAGRLALEQRYHALIAIGLGIPDDLKQRLEDRLKRLDREKRRALQLRIAAGLATVCLLVAAGIYLINDARYRNQVKAQVAVLQKLLDEKQLPDAETHLLKLKTDYPRIAAAPEIQQLEGDLKVAQQKDAVRQLEFKNLISAARRDGVDQATFKSILVARETLSKAWDVAVYTSEKAEVKDVAKLVEGRQSNLQQFVDERFHTDLTLRSDEYDRLKDSPLDNLTALKNLETAVKEIADREGVTAELSETRARPLITNIEQSIQKGSKLQSEARFIQELSASVGDRAKFLGQLERYTNQSEFAGTSRHNDFAKVAKSDLPLVAGFQSWTTFLEALMRRDLTTIDGITANKLRIDAEKLLKDYPGFSYAPQMQEIIAYLAKGASRERGSPMMEQLVAKQMFKVFSVRSDGKRYYFALEPAKDATGSLSLKYFTDTEFKTTKQGRLASFDNDAGFKSPQMIFEGEATEILSKLRDEKGANWDLAFIEMLGKLYNSPHMDPIVKTQLIPYTLKAAADGSSFLPKRLEKIKTEIDRENLNPSTNWVFPDDQEAAQVRARAETVLKRLANDLANIKPLQTEASQALESMKRPKFDLRYIWTGWTYRDQTNRWTCTFRGNAPLNQSGDLYVLSKSATGEITFTKVGQIQQGQTQLENTAELIEGRPVFERKPEPVSSKN